MKFISEQIGMIAGDEIAHNTVANAPKFSMLVTKIQKLVTTLVTRTLRYITTLCIVQLNNALETTLQTLQTEYVNIHNLGHCRS